MALPIDTHLPQIVAQQQPGCNLVLVAAPGAGKTTQVPRALCQATGQGAIWVLEPRRLAARLAARHVSAGLNERVGHTVGYRVRFDDCTGPATRLVYLTEGMLWRHLLADVALEGVDCVIFDEFHGRSLASDVGLAALRYVQQTLRPELRLVVMSATLDAEPIAALLGGAPVLHVPGRSHPVQIDHLPHRDDRPLEAQVAAAVGRICRAPDASGGDILTFLPGVPEIARAQAACAALAQAHNLCVLPLHGGLHAAAQDRVVAPRGQRRLILATNIAETSVTIAGVTWVIDSGLAKQAVQEPWSGVARLELRPISQAAAAQRAGRAGRTQPGHCLRLYTAQALARRPAHVTPEIARLDLAEVSLWLAALGLPPLSELPCVDAPPPEACAAAMTLLQRLQALPEAMEAPGPWRLTPTGQALAGLSAHPRLGRLMLEAARLGVGRKGCRAAALLGDSETLQALLRRPQRATLGTSDLEPLLRDVSAWPPHVRTTADQFDRQLRRVVRAARTPEPAVEEAKLVQAVLTAYPDRVARRMPPHGVRPGELPLQLAAGGHAHLSADSQVRDDILLVAVYARDVMHGTHARRLVQLACAVTPEMLVATAGTAVTQTENLTFDPRHERVDAVQQLCYDGLVLEERRQRPNPQAAGQVLAQAALAACQTRGWDAFFEPTALARLRGRVEIAARFGRACAALTLDDAALGTVLVRACENCLSFAELRAQPLTTLWLDTCPPQARAEIERLAPTCVRLKGGRQLEVAYAPGQTPWISSWLQDFFGSAEAPRIAEGQLPLALHLLAPNRRAVQVTQDLAGFWSRHYPALAKELGRRYPRHAWPSDPLTAAPAVSGGGRGRRRG
jgi:ATP-dependent helicase HrpB